MYPSASLEADYQGASLEAHEMSYPAAAVEGITVVLFDIYGTIMLSAEGGRGGAYLHGGTSVQIKRAFAEACSAAFLQLFALELSADDCHDFHSRYLSAIRAAHAALRERGVTAPEVEIRDIWRGILMERHQELSIAPETLTAQRVAFFAVMVEVLTNPVQLAPHIARTLSVLRARGCRFGIISNAQFYTPLILERLLGRSLAELGFEPALCYWSFQHLIAKPAASCFRYAAEAVRTHCNASPDQILYVGNDLRNDIVPAARAGFSTCLYCGDTHSLRLHPQHPDINSHRADTWVIDYDTLPTLLTQPV